MMVHCPRCDARALLLAAGPVRRPACLDCGTPLPMPGPQPLLTGGPMSPRPEPPRRRERPWMSA